jgi:hypothetical protein
MAFCDYEGFNFIPEESILQSNIKSILGYNGDKDLLLIWEILPKSRNAIKYFEPFKYLGEVKSWGFTSRGISVEFTGLLISKENIPILKDGILEKTKFD